MPKEAIFTLKLDAELLDQFMAAAKMARRPAVKVVRELMQEFIRREREYDAWFRAEVKQALRDADDPNAKFISHEEVKRDSQRRRSELVMQVAERAK